jgi:hypothetical protein
MAELVSRAPPGPPWADPRKPDVPYVYRFDLKDPGNSYPRLRAAALTVMLTLDLVPLRLNAMMWNRRVSSKLFTERQDIWRRLHHLVPGSELVIYDPRKSKEDHLSTLVVHGPGSLTLALEQGLSRNNKEFCIAHELGHYILHTKNGKIPAVFPKKSIGPHDREAVIFAAVICLGEAETDAAYAAAGRSILGTAILLSRKFKHLRFAPPGPSGKRRKKRKKRVPKSNDWLP